MGHLSTQIEKKIKYFFRGKERIATVTMVTSVQPVVYWFHFKGKPPAMLIKDNGQWYSGIMPLTADLKQGELLLVLCKAIDEQILNSQNLPDNQV
jgi:hypothetical protein